MIITHTINMDLQIRNTPHRLTMVQCDTDTRIVMLEMTSGGKLWEPGTVDRVLVRYRKSDGTGGSYDSKPDGTSAWSLNGAKLELWMAPQVLTVPGLVEMQAAMFREERCLATFCFQIAVEADPSVGAVESEDYVNWTQWAKQELEKHLKYVQQSGEFRGACFYPSVDENSWLRWTNEIGLENPEPVKLSDILVVKLEDDGYLKLSGGTMNGPIVLEAPEAEDHAVNKAYVDAKRFSAQVTLPAGGWIQAETGFTQTVAVEGILSSDWPHYAVMYSDAAQTALQEKAAFARVDDLWTAEGSVTFFCFEEAPGMDLVIQMEVNR